MRKQATTNPKALLRRGLALLCAVWLCALSVGCSLLPVEDEPLAAPILRANEKSQYTTYRVTRGDLQMRTDVTTSYIPTRTEGLFFAEGGLLFKDVFASVGDIVQPGQVLITLESEALDLSIEALERQKETNQRELENLEALYELEKDPARYTASSRQITLSYNQKKNDLLSAGKQIDLQLELQRQQKSQRIMRAGIGGVVTAMQDIRDGDRSVQGDQIITIADKTSSVFVARNRNYELLTPGMEVEIALSDNLCRAQVVDAGTLGITSEEPAAYLVLQEEGIAIRDNAVGIVTLVTDERKNALYVPSAAVHTARDETFVYVLENNIRITKPVVIGLDNGKSVEIVSGLAEGEEIVV